MSSQIPADEVSRYADVIVQVGVNLQQGQRLLIRADLQTAPLVRAVARSAYRAGARLVEVNYGDEQLGLVRIQEAAADSLDLAPAWQPALAEDYLRSGDALLSIYAATPTLLAGEDPARVSRVIRAGAQASRPVTELVQRNASAWAVVAYPTAGWAAEVLPHLPTEEREAALWRAIASTCRLDVADPVGAWKEHVSDLNARAAHLNAKGYTALRYRAPGTDLTVGLPAGHLWTGGDSLSERGQSFVPNLPTEEVFSLPDRARVEGVVRSSRPLNYGGNLIDDFTLTFAGGRVVKAAASRGEETLRRLLDTDEGAARLGEVALVPNSSPVSRTGMLFANTLFDENAACHLALGSGYRFCLQGGADLDSEGFAAAGGNVSNVHVDFMIGSGGMEIDGVTADGRAEPIMRAGEWAFSV